MKWKLPIQAAKKFSYNAQSIAEIAFFTSFYYSQQSNANLYKSTAT